MIKREKRVKRKRRFLGKIDNFIDKQEQAFEKKHLKAYIRGDKQFVIGYKGEGNFRTPVYSLVKQELVEVK